MKEISKKIIAIIFIMLMLINSSLLTIISTAAEEIKNNIDASKIEVKNEINLEKYINYFIQNQKGVLVKLNYQTGIEYKENQEYKAIKSTKTELQVPQINGEFPENVNIQAISTKATNGSDNAKDYEYSYDKETGKISINVLNKEDENNNIYTENVEGARDTFKINLYYSSNCYNDQKETKTLELSGKIVETLDTNDNTEITSNIDKKGEVSENISGLISADIETNEIYNGNIYANINNGTENSTQYTETMNLNVDYQSIADNVEITEDDTFITDQDVEIGAEYIKYKKVKINKNSVLDVLGEDGNLQILNNNEDILLEINKDTQAEEDGTIIKQFENEEESLNIKISKPTKIGTIKIENTKVIKETYLNVNDNTIKTQTNIKALNKVKQENEQTEENVQLQETEIYNFSNSYKIKINDSQTKIDLSIDKQNWTNNTANDVNFTIKLISNDIKYNLFKNPVIEMELPEDVDKVILGDTALLYNDDNFEQKTELIDNGTNKIIRITLNGTQKKYYENLLYEGIYIIVPAKITLKSDITTNDTNVKITYYNENGKINDYTAEGQENKQVEIKELDEKQEQRLSIARYQVNTEENQSETNTEEINAVSETQTIEGLDVIIFAQVGNKILQDGDNVYEKQIITYKTEITNNTSTELKNLKLVGKIAEGTTYVEVQEGEDDIEDMEKMYKYVGDTNVKEQNIEIESIASKETLERTYEVEVNELPENTTEKEIIANIKLYVNSNNVAEKDLKNIVKKQTIYARMVSTMGGFENEDNKWEYCLLITNNTEEIIKNAEVSVNIPKCMEVYETGSLTNDVTVGDETIENGFYKATVSQLPIGKQVILRIYMQPKNLDKNEYIYNLEVAAEIKATGIETYNTNINYQEMYTREITVTMSSNSEGKDVKYEETVEYNVNISVNGSSEKFSEVQINVLDYLPEELTPEEVKYLKWEYDEENQYYKETYITEDISSKIIEDGEEGTNPDVNLYLTIPNEFSVDIKIKATADLIPEDKEIANSVSVSTDEGDVIISNTVKFTLKAGTTEDDKEDSTDDETDDNNDGDSDDNGNNEDQKDDDISKEDKKTYEISGQVWLDTNKDGKKGEKEEKISEITVKLFDATTNAIITSKEGEKYITTTDNEGKYKFENLANGKYLVIFEYDNKTYELTDYQKSEVSEELNSDVISKEISIDGKIEVAGVTDIISIESEDKENIDVGLIKGEILDLRLDKFVSKITVANSKETKEYDYENQKLAKVEIASKQIADTTITIKYKIVVTNEGEKAAYISEITDYLPEGLQFETTEGNWEMQQDGSIKIHGLAGLLLKPGMSKTIEITAVAKDLGKFVNTAEITLTKNDSNTKDIDSTEGNKNKEEDDYSEATVIVAVKTGAIIGTSIGVILAIALIVIFVILSKKNKKFRKFTKMSFLLLIVTSTLTVMTTYTHAQTVAEKKEELKKQYTTNMSYTIYTGSQYFYSHDTPYSTVVNSDKLHCTDGKKAMCGVGQHKYEQNSVTVTMSNVKKTKTTANTYTATEKVSTGEKLNNSYKIYGPYKIERTNDDKITKDEIKSMILFNTNGNKINNSKWEICDKKGNSKEFAFNKVFYIKIVKSAKPEHMEIAISNEITVSYNAHVKIQEKWYCVETSEGSHNGHTCYNKDNAQPLERVYEKNIDWTETNSKIKTIKLKMKESNIKVEKEGKAQIKKIDDRSATSLENVGFTFSTTIKSYDLYNSVNHYHWVDHGYYIYVPYTVYNKKGKPRTKYNKVWVSDWRYDLWYTINYYHWVEHTVYLQNNRTWGYNAGIFYTDENGIVSGNGTLSLNTYAWNDRSQGNNHTEYAYFVGTTVTAREVYTPYYGYNTGNVWTLNRNSNETVVATNHQYRVKLSGYVWLDEQSGKLSMTDSEHNGENGLNGLTVKLKDRSGNTIQTTYTNEYGIYDEIYGGEYRFYDVSLDKLQNGEYHVEFEYCGIDYQSVNPNIYGSEGSKALDTISRTYLDNCFSTVNGNGTQNLNVNGVSLYYNQENQNASSINRHGGCTVQASTDEAGYYIYTDFVPTSEEIKYVNLGVFKKVQTDYALAQDLYNVRVGVNGFQHVYRYASLRYLGLGEITNDNSSWNVGVKFQNNKGSYKRAIYEADYDYTNSDKSKEISVYVTYKVTLKNEGTYLGRINSIIDYCDSNYEIEAAGYSINEDDKITDNISVEENQNTKINGYRKYLINTSERNIEAEEEQTLYIQFKMNKEAIHTIMNNGETKHNLIEINSYTTFDDDTGKPIAVYDVDSVPGNAQVENFNTYEDDTDSARSLQLEFKNERSIEGSTFVDGTGKGEAVEEGQERIGDGIYTEGKNSNDKVLKDVQITMTEVDEQGNKINNGLVYTTKTDDEGNFKISNYVAGNYQITYTWGNETYKVQYYKGTIYNKTRNDKTQSDPYWYKGLEYENDTKSKDERLTDALDNAQIREDIDNEMKKVTKNTLEQEISDAYKNGYNSQGKNITITKMDSTTPIMAMSVEYDTTVTNGDDSDRVEFVIKNVDFGIVERAKQRLELSKRVSAYKIKLANGQILVDVQINEEGKMTGTNSYTIFNTNKNYVNNTNVRGLLKTEMDNELIEGATLEVTYTIKVKNVSEKDYVTEDYYYFGIKDEKQIVKSSVTQLIDYVDGRLSVLDDNWDDAEKGYEKEYNVSEKDDSTYLNKIKTYLTTKLAKPLAPSESNQVTLHTSKLLTTTDDNQFDNQAEITEVIKTNGFSSGGPVKMTWEGDGNHFNIANAETVTIIPSTGENKNYTTPIIIAIVVITILGTGIVCIKKFVI